MTDEELTRILKSAVSATVTHPMVGRTYLLDVERLIDEVRRLRALTDSLAGRVAAQSALLSARAEKPPDPRDDSDSDWR